MPTMDRSTSINTCSLDSFEGLHQAIQGSHVEVTQLGRGRFCGALSHVGIGIFRSASVRFRSARGRSTLRPATTTIGEIAMQHGFIELGRFSRTTRCSANILRKRCICRNTFRARLTTEGLSPLDDLRDHRSTRLFGWRPHHDWRYRCGGAGWPRATLDA
jgi:hypothetical protein